MSSADTTTDHFSCTYCGDPLAEYDETAAGDELHCENCDVTYDLVAESDRHDLVVFVCPYCGTENKRAQGVDRVVCEDHPRYGGDCGLEFDPAGVETRVVADSDESERPKMVPQDGGGA